VHLVLHISRACASQPHGPQAAKAPLAHVLYSMGPASTLAARDTSTVGTTY